MTPHVAHLSLSHFRSHRRTRLDLDGRPVALFGPNGAGKTNLMEAVSLLSPGRGLRRATAEEIIRRPEAIGWKVRADLAGPGLGHEVELSAEPDTPRAVRINEKPAPQVALARLIRIVWLVPAQDRLWIEGADGRRRFLDRMTMSFLPDHAEDVLTYEKAMRERNRLLRTRCAIPPGMARWNARWPRPGPPSPPTAPPLRTALPPRRRAPKRPSPPHPSRWRGRQGPPEAPDLATAFAEGRPRDMAAGRTLIGPHRADLGAVYVDKDAPARQCSTGEQKALLISLVLANARGLKTETGAAPLILLDEVAAHLDAARRAALVRRDLRARGAGLDDRHGARTFRRAWGPGAAYRRAGGARRVRGHRPVTLTATQLGLYATALFVLFLTPGPVWLATAARALAHGWVAAVPLVLGVALGDALWSVTAALGLAWIVGTYGWVMDVLKWVAVAVFALMGVLLIRHADKTISADSALIRPGAMAGFLAGLAAILANPKAILFYMGMLPGFFDLTRVTALDIAAIAAISILVPLIGNTGFAILVDTARRRFSSPERLARINRIAGGLLIAVAV
jgi:DNA replication and repair protein RecF